MANIVAAQFDDFNVVDAALRSLSEAGFAPTSVDTYFLNAAGQHARFPIGGDQDVDPEAHGAEKGALAGAAIGGAAGAALGLVAAPFAGPAAAAGAIAAGVYAGSRAGAQRTFPEAQSAGGGRRCGLCADARRTGARDVDLPPLPRSRHRRSRRHLEKRDLAGL